MNERGRDFPGQSQDTGGQLPLQPSSSGASLGGWQPFLQLRPSWSCLQAAVGFSNLSKSYLGETSLCHALHWAQSAYGWVQSQGSKSTKDNLEGVKELNNIPLYRPEPNKAPKQSQGWGDNDDLHADIREGKWKRDFVSTWSWCSVRFLLWVLCCLEQGIGFSLSLYLTLSFSIYI